MDPMLVEFMKGSISRGLDERVTKELDNNLELHMNAIRKGDYAKASYLVGIVDGLAKVLCIFTSIRETKLEE